MENEYRYESYKPCHCGGDCCGDDDTTAETPCWGQVVAVEDMGDDGFIHMCQGHKWTWLHESENEYRAYVAEGEVWPPTKNPNQRT
jgi:hypothetical protein